MASKLETGTALNLQELLVSRTQSGLTRALMWLGAVLLLISGIEHVHLWDVAYRHVATLGPLFIVQAVLCVVMAIALAIGRRFFLVLSALALMVGTVLGFVLVLTTGLFGFKLGFVSGLAYFILVVELVAIVVLAVAAWMMLLENRATGTANTKR